jgi:hypothetical protein
MTKKNIQNTMNLTTFIKKYDLEYTWFYNNGVYTVYIKDLQILSENSCSTSEFGIGFTKKQALNEYANKIQNKNNSPAGKGPSLGKHVPLAMSLRR